MKNFEFPYTVSFGKLDSYSDVFTYALSDANSKRLIRSAEEGERYRLNEDPFISDICNKVYKALDKEITEQLQRDPTPVRDALSWDNTFDSEKPIGKNEIQKYLDTLMISVNYPEDLQLLEAKMPAKTTTARYEIMDEAQADKIIKQDCYGNNVIILTDEGKTLYYVPKKFTGSITIPSSVRKIRSGFGEVAIAWRKQITEVIIEDGLQEIEERAFCGCTGLKNLVIPGSVKKLGHHAFSGCSSLKQVILPEGLEEIYYSSFEGCYNLESLSLPASLKEMYMLDIRNIYFMGKETTITEDLAVCTWNRTILHVLPGSQVEKFAREKNIRYFVMKEKKQA